MLEDALNHAAPVGMRGEVVDLAVKGLTDEGNQVRRHAFDGLLDDLSQFDQRQTCNECTTVVGKRTSPRQRRVARKRPDNNWWMTQEIPRNGSGAPVHQTSSTYVVPVLVLDQLDHVALQLHDYFPLLLFTDHLQRLLHHPATVPTPKGASKAQCVTLFLLDQAVRSSN